MSSDPPFTRPPLATLEHQQPPLLPLVAAGGGGGGVSALSPSSSILSREYRKGNWTVQETLILITAKRLDDDRRNRGSTTTSSDDPSAGPRSAEQRWKWVENYCWKQGCFRSQNQCNDKWDNLLRDYKKVRDYESRAAASSTSAEVGPTSYWTLERHERKERNLPTNLVFEVYEALSDVLSRRGTLRGSCGASAAPHPRPLPLPPPPPPPPPVQATVSGEMTPEGSSETEGCGGGGDGSPPSPPGGKRRRGIGSSVVRGAAELARTLLACEERKERRHRDLMELEERRLRMEENRTEMNRQAVAGLIAAVNGLSAAIHSLVADHRSTHGR